MSINQKIQNELTSGEVINVAVNPSKLVMLKSLVIILISLLIMLSGHGAGTLVLIIGLVLLVRDFIYIKSTQLAVTNKRVLVKTGWLSVDVKEIRASKVESVTVDQSAINRVFNIGSVIITGSGSQRVSLDYVTDPRNVKNIITAVTEG